MNNVIIRDASINDAKELLDIYSYYILNTAITFEEEIPQLDEFKNRIIDIKSKYPYLVVEYNNEILGYIYASSYSKRSSYRFICETSIYLKHGYTNLGYGKLLYLALEERLKNANIYNMYACIAHTNNNDEYLTNNSEEFHMHIGFNKICHMHKCGYKFNRWYDVLWLEKILVKH